MFTGWIMISFIVFPDWILPRERFYSSPRPWSALPLADRSLSPSPPPPEAPLTVTRSTPLEDAHHQSLIVWSPYIQAHPLLHNLIRELSIFYQDRYLNNETLVHFFWFGFTICRMFIGVCYKTAWCILYYSYIVHLGIYLFFMHIFILASKFGKREFRISSQILSSFNLFSVFNSSLF